VTGPEHHREAERLVELARKAAVQQRPYDLPLARLDVGSDLPGKGRLRNTPDDDRDLYDHDPGNGKVRNLLAEAQVHATLALAAALQESQPDRTSWPAAASPRPEPATPDATFTGEPSTVKLGDDY
jgi:hypothetical protein